MVAAGANPGADIVFYKSSNNSGGKMFDLNTVPEPFRKAVGDELARLERELEIAKTATEAADAAVVPVAEDSSPTIPVEIQKHLDLQGQEITKLRKQLEAAEEKDFVAGFQAELPNLPAVDKIAKGLFSMSKSNAGLVDDIRAALLAAHSVAKTSAAVLTTELGSSGGLNTPGSAYEKAVALAKSRVDNKLAANFSQAIVDVYRENPALYDEYEAEKA
jgi:hypothetical protein